MQWETWYTPFGRTVGLNQGELELNFRLPGQYYDAETSQALGSEIYYNWHRYYMPGVGRYLQPDPVIFPYEQVGSYPYALNSPLMHVDYNGEIPWKKLYKIAGEWWGKLMPHADGKNPRVKFYDKKGNYKEAKIYADGKMGGKNQSNVPKHVRDKAVDELNKKLGCIGIGVLGGIGELFDPFDPIAGELSDPNDMNENGTPDYYEPDTNGNGVPDAWEGI